MQHTDWFVVLQLNARSADQRLTWDEAREDCANQGADLASFHSHDDLENFWRSTMA
jgi:hypothetical protein